MAKGNNNNEPDTTQEKEGQGWFVNAVTKVAKTVHDTTKLVLNKIMDSLTGKNKTSSKTDAATAAETQVYSDFDGVGHNSPDAVYLDPIQPSIQQVERTQLPLTKPDVEDKKSTYGFDGPETNNAGTDLGQNTDQQIDNKFCDIDLGSEVGSPEAGLGSSKKTPTTKRDSDLEDVDLGSNTVSSEADLGSSKKTTATTKGLSSLITEAKKFLTPGSLSNDDSCKKVRPSRVVRKDIPDKWNIS